MSQNLWDEVNKNKSTSIDHQFDITNESNRYDLIYEIANYVKDSVEEKQSLYDLMTDTAQIDKQANLNWIGKLFGKKKKCGNDTKLRSENTYLINPKRGIKLISKLLETKPANSNIGKLYEDLCSLIDNEYMEFADQDDLPNEAEMLDRLNKLRNKLENAIMFPEMLNKTIIGIGGGFSAGKSSFINAILNSPEDILPTDTRPTTSIPTYVINGEKESGVFSYNIFGDKQEIDNKALLAISHEFYRLYGLSLTTVIKKIAVETSRMKYKRIAFLDTPGYTKSENKAKSDTTDETIAKGHLIDADYLIWVIDIEQGTIPRNDINFLTELNFEKQILIVFNKADKKPESEVQKIIDKSVNLLLSKNLNIETVIAYSSIDKLEYCSGSEIEKFLESNNKPKKLQLFSEDISKIMKVYEDYHAHSIDKSKRLLDVLNKIDTIAYKQLGSISEFSEILDDARKTLRERKRIQTLLFELRDKFLNTTMAIDKYFGKVR